jgi:nucleoid DNA-binding protein
MPSKKMTKSEFIVAVAQKSGLEKKQVAAALAGIVDVAVHELGKKGPGQVTVPGLAIITAKLKPATKAHPGKNPFTGEAIIVKAKPAKWVMRARFPKGFKDSVK